MYYGGIEAGGTKFVCAIGEEDGRIIERIELTTLTPDETIQQVVEFFQKEDIKAIGVGSFGPIDINVKSNTYGYITTTPKVSWANYPFLHALKQHFNIPIAFNTDVNVAALGEATLGAARGLESCLYITVGTGIGAGAVVNGKILQGLSHPEMGHILLRRHKEDQYIGKCPYHKDCFEGLTAGPAIEERWGKKGIELAEDDKVWELAAYYIAQALMQYILILSPERIILGGGVMKQSQLFPFIHEKIAALINKYVYIPPLTEYIVPPELGDNAGIIGALILAGKMEQ
ncbi:ROK family protein [Bacillus sp. FJAT-49736]|uniref:ROK family protein n=1 Tax=Bacillus sp. FJAT-49736 TaxID=2833582 RepID=UPI001BCA5B81|nr:ROK family protein [Bacillus sp. FJAT-49736]MBS4174468.1 ROK family protein [Bacillus sp. FJAT-49736]MBS4175825.1 ROK family protein [Bacillus sp. FJAT-49736]